jgi:hypothetical protein
MFLCVLYKYTILTAENERERERDLKRGKKMEETKERIWDTNKNGKEEKILYKAKITE